MVALVNTALGLVPILNAIILSAAAGLAQHRHWSSGHIQWRRLRPGRGACLPGALAAAGDLFSHWFKLLYWAYIVGHLGLLWEGCLLSWQYISHNGVHEMGLLSLGLRQASRVCSSPPPTPHLPAEPDCADSDVQLLFWLLLPASGPAVCKIQRRKLVGSPAPSLPLSASSSSNLQFQGKPCAYNGFISEQPAFPGGNVLRATGLGEKCCRSLKPIVRATVEKIGSSPFPGFLCLKRFSGASAGTTINMTSKYTARPLAGHNLSPRLRMTLFSLELPSGALSQQGRIYGLLLSQT